MKPFNIRSANAADLNALKTIIDNVGLFPSAMLDDMMTRYLAENVDQEIWLVAESEGVLGIAYCAAERMTSGTENLLLLAVAPEAQRKGVATALVQAIAQTAAAKGAHLLLVETSSSADFDGPRRFYANQGFSEVARIADYYQPGEGKVTFAKRLR
jgi:ribosomal protein S18 acetylase RimI-like enzyme